MTTRGCRNPLQRTTGLWLWVGASAVSDLAGSTVQIAILLHAFHLTGGSVSVLGVNAALVLLPAVVAAPIAGVLARRHGPRRIMLASELVRLGSSLLLLVGGGNVYSLLALQAVLSAGGALYAPARQSLLPQLVDPSGLHAANAIMATIGSMVLLIGPILGSFAFAAGGLALAALADAVLYLGAAVMLLAIRAPVAGKALRPPRFAQQLKEGFALFREAPDLRRLVVLTLTAGASVGLLVPLLRPFVDDVLHGDDRSYGLLMGAFGLGGLAGPALAVLTARSLGLGRSILIGFAVEPLVMLVWTCSPLLSLSAAVMFLWGVVVFALVTCQSTYVQQFAPRELVPSAFAVLEQAGHAAQLLAALAVVAIVPVATPQRVLLVAALCYLGIALFAWLSPGGRLMRTREALP